MQAKVDRQSFYLEINVIKLSLFKKAAAEMKLSMQADLSLKI